MQKQSYLDNMTSTRLERRRSKSNKLLHDVVAAIQSINGKQAAPIVIAKYFASHQSGFFFHSVLNAYKNGLLIKENRTKLSLQLRGTLGVAQTVDILDTVSGINFTGLMKILQKLSPSLPEDALPGKKAIKDLRDVWSKQMVEKLEVSPIPDEYGWDLNPIKLLHFLVEEVYTELQYICEVGKLCGIITVTGRRIERRPKLPLPEGSIIPLNWNIEVTFEGTDPQLCVGDTLTIDGRTEAIYWVAYPLEKGERRKYFLSYTDQIVQPTKEEDEETEKLQRFASDVPRRVENATYQRAIQLARTADGRTVVGRKQVAEVWRVLNKELKIAHSVDHVWVSMVLGCPENFANVSIGRKRQLAELTELLKSKKITVQFTNKQCTYPIHLWGPADMKNLMLMLQRGGNPGTTIEFCSHCARARNMKDEEGVIYQDLLCYRVGSGKTPESISELDVADCPYCAIHADARMVEKDVEVWVEEAQKKNPALAKSRLKTLETIIKGAFGEHSNWAIYADKEYPIMKMRGGREGLY